MTSGRHQKYRSLKEAFGPASQAEMYLARALEEFHHSANPADLWLPVDALHRGSILDEPQAAMTAMNRRLHFLRSTVLFAALAAEAFANELLNELLPAADAEALDRLPTPEKLAMGTHVATGESPLKRGAQPMQDLVLLFKTRNRLVHPRPQGGIAAWARDVEASDELVIGPKAALSAIVAVAEAVALCTELRRHPILHGGTAKTILRHRHILDRHSELGGPKILDIPKRTEPSSPPLMDQMMQIVADAMQQSRDLETP
jgi:hypothetical protein